MVINYYGEGCLKLESGKTSLLIDPSNNRLKADIIVRTISSLNFDGQPPADEIIFPGEYEVKGVNIQGWALSGESDDKMIKTAYKIKWEEITVAALGYISKPLPENILENLENPDILFIPASPSRFLKADIAERLVKKIRPAIIIPTFYKNESDAAKFFDQKVEAEDKFVFKKKDLTNKKERVIILKTN